MRENSLSPSYTLEYTILMVTWRCNLWCRTLYNVRLSLLGRPYFLTLNIVVVAVPLFVLPIPKSKSPRAVGQTTIHRTLFLSAPYLHRSDKLRFLACERLMLFEKVASKPTNLYYIYRYIIIDNRISCVEFHFWPSESK